MDHFEAMRRAMSHSECDIARKRADLPHQRWSGLHHGCFLVRLGEPIAVAQAVLGGFRQRDGSEFWPDGASYLDIDLHSVLGHRQVTGAYLVGLTKTHATARLATMDEGLALAFPNETFLLPTITGGLTRS
jgi:hypothetical protein